MRERRSDRFLDAQFREFYREVIRWKARVEVGAATFDGEHSFAGAPNLPKISDTESPPDPAGAPGASADPYDDAPAVWKSLLTILERQALRARRSGGDLAMSIFRQAQYVMAALADEVFLHIDWPGRDAWGRQLLEARLFDSHRAGETVFERIDEILRHRDVVFLELAGVYLMALALGFQGKYRDQETGQMELAGYRDRLFQFIYNREPDLDDTRRRLVPEAYASILDQGSPRRLPYLRNWLLGFAVVFVAWVVTGQVIWSRLTSDLNEILHSIL